MGRRKIDFWSLVDTSGDCWLWTGRLDDSGYGRVGKRSIPAHRSAYESIVGPIPLGHELDHLCHGRDATCAGGRSCAHRRCVNPAHLEPVTHGENVRRGLSFAAANGQKAECLQGHPFSSENTYVWNGWRMCRACRRLRRAA